MTGRSRERRSDELPADPLAALLAGAGADDGLSFLMANPQPVPPAPLEQPEPEDAGAGPDPIEALVADVSRLEAAARELKSPWAAPVDRSVGIALALETGRRLAELKRRHAALSGAARKQFEIVNQEEAERLLFCARQWPIAKLQAEHQAAAPARAAHAASLAAVAEALELARAKLTRALTRRERQGSADGGAVS